jgi:hypothetical protein
MAELGNKERIEDVSAGDIVAIDRGCGEQPYKVVFKDSADAGYLVTFEDDDGNTFQLELAAGTTVPRALESKWESPQSPTPHTER